MKSLITHTVLLLVTIYSGFSHSQIIELETDLALPALLTEKTNFTADFGYSGDRVNVLDITVDVTFSGNLWSSGETFVISWLEDPLLAWESKSLLVRNDTSSLSLLLTSVNVSDLNIDDTGLAYFKIGVIGGDGAYFDSVNLTANATIQAVPIPGSIILFISGLAFLTRTSYRNYFRA